VLGFAVFLGFSKNARLKKRVWPWYMAGIDAAYIVAVCYHNPGPLLIVIPGLMSLAEYSDRFREWKYRALTVTARWAAECVLLRRDREEAVSSLYNARRK
jgi:hypothetical protein